MQSKDRSNTRTISKQQAFRNVICIILMYFANSIVSAQDGKLYEFSAEKYLMGTQFRITAVHTSIDSMKKAIYYSLREVERIQGVMSMQMNSSEIYKINTNAGIEPVKVTYETYSIIKRAIEYSLKFEGVFDITIGPVSECWGFNSDKAITQIPEKFVIDSLLKYVGSEKIILNPADTSVYLPLKGMLLDLGGIAKGYAVDRAADIMKTNGITNFIVNGGGDMFVCGYKNIRTMQKWNVGIKHPREENTVVAVLEINDMAVGTSGDYERFLILDNVRYHHIFDTKTGWPSNTSESATSITTTTEEAVVLSKYFFIKGGSIFKQNYSLNGVIVDSSGNVVCTPEMHNIYNITLSK
ncbi:MAG: FAD:protein FMN transferase [Ignavibacteria bacterium]|nr:FAD:protein FMN transferase [Ignavibacteria bacterium]